MQTQSTEIKSLLTQFVTEEFLGAEAQLFNFLSLIHAVHQRRIDEWVERNNFRSTDIMFLYKGGNTLREVALSFERDMPPPATLVIERYFNKDFKRSDCDFTIYVNPRLPNETRIASEMAQLSYDAQREICGFINDAPWAFFKFYRASLEQRTIALKQLLELGAKRTCICRSR